MAGRFIMEGVPTSHNPELHITFPLGCEDSVGESQGVYAAF
jgi:hypothetical protein